MADFGGEMRFNFNGTPLTLRGDVKVSPSNVGVDPITNQDNSTSRTFKPKGYSAEVKFEDTQAGSATDQDWNAIIRGGPYNMSLLEVQTSTLHTWTGAKFVGEPDVDRMNGEVSGLKIHANTYKKTAA